jgi:hypothetical protein
LKTISYHESCEVGLAVSKKSKKALLHAGSNLPRVSAIVNGLSRGTESAQENDRSAEKNRQAFELSTNIMMSRNPSSCDNTNVPRSPAAGVVSKGAL